jgi:serine O-acetyltransferase
VSAWRDFTRDVARYTELKGSASRLYLVFEQGLWALAVYRFGRWARDVRVPLLGRLLRGVAFLVFKGVEIATGISLPPSATIGAGLHVGHFGGIIVHSDAILGERCAIGPGVVIGARGQGVAGTPVLGDGVYVGVGAKILGPVTIGSDVRIGANSVVISDLPDHATAVGIPARIVRILGQRPG